MATVHLADKVSKKIDERFHFNSYTESMAGNAYEFEGVKKIKIYNVDTAPMHDYTRSGSSRYGTPAELTDRQYELEMTQDKSATWTIDKGNQLEQFNIKGANQSANRQTNEVVIPMVDKYAFKKWVAGAGSKVVLASAMTANTAIAAFNDAVEALDNRAVPEAGRTCVIRNSKYKLLKQAPQFIYTDKLANGALVKGKVGEIDGVAIKPVPDKYLPADVDMLITQQKAILRPKKLFEYNIHQDPPGISGNLVEFRMMYDAFVLDAVADAVCVVTSNASILAPNVTIAFNATANTGTIGATGFDKIFYTLDGSDPRSSGTAIETNANVSINATVGATATEIRAVAYKANATVQYGIAGDLEIAR